jgi:hypothetical protein
MFTLFAVVHDPRWQHPTTLQTLGTIITISILATICGVPNWVEIAYWVQAKAARLAEFLNLPQGIPSHDSFGGVFAVLDPESLREACVSWMNALAELRHVCCVTIRHLGNERRDAVKRVRRKPRIIRGCFRSAKL